MDLENIMLCQINQRQVPYITYMWNLKKQYQWTYLQNRTRVTDVEDSYQGGGRRRNKLGHWD